MLIETTQSLFDNVKETMTASIPFSEEVRGLCEQNMCGNFGKSWTCPPAIDDLDTLKSKIAVYPRFLVFNKVYPLEDSFDWEGMVSSIKDFQARVVKLRRRILKLSKAFDFMVLGAGACSLCETCSYGEKKPCRNPKEAVYSIEAFGMDATALMTANGLAYNNGPNTVTYVGGLFYDQLPDSSCKVTL